MQNHLSEILRQREQQLLMNKLSTANQVIEKLVLNSKSPLEQLRLNTHLDHLPQETVSLGDTEILNRSIYHKIANETSLLRLIASRIARKSETEELNEIIDQIELIDEEIKKRRAIEQGKLDKICQDNYDEIIEIISKTAHDISDYVNNELATIALKVRRYMKKINTDDPVYPKFEKLLQQLTITQNTLNDLKSINEGIDISNNRFYIGEIFDRWETNVTIKNARILLNIENAESEFKGDEEKIKSMINEMIENSLKHNPDQLDLQITITSKDVINPWYKNIPDQQRFLFIEFSDNGKGIPPDKKDWIFQPLTTTSAKTQGSGLGLFIIRKTLEKMKGCIRETGENGAKFEIYIPYQ